MLVLGLSLIQVSEFAISLMTYDSQIGIHMLYMIIIFNYTPVRFEKKAICCSFLVVVFVVASLIVATIGNPEDAPIQDYLYKSTKKSLVYRWMYMAGTILAFLAMSLATTFGRETTLVENHLAIKFGEIQNRLLGKRKLLNDMLLNSMLPEEITKQMREVSLDE